MFTSFSVPAVVVVAVAVAVFVAAAAPALALALARCGVLFTKKPGVSLGPCEASFQSRFSTTPKGNARSFQDIDSLRFCLKA